MVEDPYIQGRIAACNVLSDLYAMGVTEIDTILMVLAVSLKMNELEREVITSQMIEGFNSIAEEANTSVSGGQTILNPWPIIGGVAISAVKPDNYIKPNFAREGDVIILTKRISTKFLKLNQSLALGTQIAVNVYSYFSNQNEKWNIIKNFVNETDVIDAYNSASKFMSRKNLNAALLMKKYGAHAATDVTGFGILGHAKYLAKAQKEEVGFKITRVPVLKGMKRIDKTEARNFKSFKKIFFQKFLSKILLNIQISN